MKFYLKSFAALVFASLLFTACSDDQEDGLLEETNVTTDGYLIDQFENDTTINYEDSKTRSQLISTFCGFVDISGFSSGIRQDAPITCRSCVYFQFDWNFTQSPPPPPGLVTVTYEFIVGGVTYSESSLFTSSDTTINDNFNAYTEPTEWRMKIENCLWTPWMPYNN